MHAPLAVDKLARNFELILTMGASDSNPETEGWRILEVMPNGPCWDKGLCVYFDFIVGINGYRLNTSSEEFWDLIRTKQNSEIILTVFNYKTRVKRDIQMTPNNNWGGDGLLGLVIVRDDFTKCDKQCIRVLSVSPKSPASKAGLTAESDYILGTPINAFVSFSVFRDTVSDYIDQPLPMYVYNSKNAEIRLVEIKPSSQWPGDGVLGCEVGDGYLHHIPSLTEAQESILFKPSSSYVVSSRNSSNANKHYHSSNVESTKHIQTATESKEEEEELIRQTVDNVIEETQRESVKMENANTKKQEVPSKGPTQQTQMESAAKEVQADIDTATVIPSQQVNLLDQLENETKEVLAQQ